MAISKGDVYPKARRPRGWRAARQPARHDRFFPAIRFLPAGPPSPARNGCRSTEAQTMMKIPVLPISYGDAQPLLANLDGPVAPEAWRGALPITYHLGPGSAIVHLKVVMDNRRVRSTMSSPDSRLRVSRPVGDGRQSSRRLGAWRQRSSVRCAARSWRPRMLSPP